jgi:purine-binding chemotaxis protein CheW
MSTETVDTATQTQVVVLPVGRDRYAVPIEWVREVVAAPAVTPLVTAGPPVLGLLNLRGEIVPLFDTAALLGVGTIGAPQYAAVLLTPLGSAGLAATGLPHRALLDSPAAPSELPGTAGLHHVQGHPTVLLDPEVLLVPERLGAPADLPSVGF